MIRKPFKKLSSQSTAGGQYTPPRAEAPPMTEYPPRPKAKPESSIEDSGNSSRIRAGAHAGQNGFTCVRCLQWFPAGTHHACRPYADTIRNPETVAPVKGPMSADEVILLQQEGQL